MRMEGDRMRPVAPDPVTAPLRLRGTGAPVDPQALLHAMQVVRAVETALYEAGLRGDLEGPVHVSLGQEAVAVGVAAAMASSDRMLSTHRGHGHALAMGLDPRRVVAEILCHPDGYGGGVGGSMHLISTEHGFLGTNGVVGANTGLALGAALAAELHDDARAVVCLIGDGAMGTGIVYESLNLAALWSAPVVFVCEHNQYAEMTPTHVHLASAPHHRAASFGLASSLVDGDDVEEVQRALVTALSGARSGRPAFVECTTHRWTGHYVGDPQTYRPEGEADGWRAHDPIERLATRLGVDPVEEGTRLLDEARRLMTELLAGTATR
jgi:TPP-dependent pyruvate/acetoin dehydrogenase alpha subunit